MPKVYNKRTLGVPKDAVYVGRPTKWGNPFTHETKRTLAQTKVANRQVAVEAFRLWLEEQPELLAAAKAELRGKDLVCWCSPLACHADVLLEVANEESCPCDSGHPERCPDMRLEE